MLQAGQARAKTDEVEHRLMRYRGWVRAGPPPTSVVAKALGTAVLFGIGAGFVAGLILPLVDRGALEAGIDRIRTAPLGNLLSGLAVLILAPVVAVLSGSRP